MVNRQPYRGSARTLVISMDVGTTFSGVGYSILDPGEVPKIMGVRRFPGQEDMAGSSKIPSILYYDKFGSLKAIGAEALSSSIVDKALEEDWFKVEWFKLRLRPDSMASVSKDSQFARMATLPHNKTIDDVLADFYSYLYNCTRRFILETHPSGQVLWDSLARECVFILSHPNGWEGAQQAQMRRAAIRAGLAPDSPEGYERIQFVTEGEASVHFCVVNDTASEAIKDKETIMVIDAGGGTVDISTYSVKVDGDQMSMAEISPPECIFDGSATITFRTREYLLKKLCGSRYGSEDQVADMVTIFDKWTKHLFRDDAETSYIRFGSLRDRDAAYGIRNGQISLSGTDVASLFEPSVAGIKEAIRRQCQSTQTPISKGLLVGGFAASPWLFKKLQVFATEVGLDLSRPDTHTNKAVAEGAVAFYIDHFVSARMARFTYGTECTRPFNSDDLEHISRERKTYIDNDGRKKVPYAFSAILKKGTRVSEEQEFSRSYNFVSVERMTQIAANIVCYRGSMGNPRWVDVEPNTFKTLCTVSANVSDVPMKPLYGPRGDYYKFEIDIVLLFGLTELKAQLRWVDEGKEKRCPAAVVFEKDDGLEMSSAP
ncbi:hypothetical protein OBBRIDRAFT_755931 [Obba rivulosa]|uniref:Uncharacterized protein n=1 Tax=Obba rivulosa TaxID=1052685 RepID=A0A8E2ASN9_9APHY|nr:hypothetical protein OBBRIDRAFT_755931 [Obba rivulosa]